MREKSMKLQYSLKQLDVSVFISIIILKYGLNIKIWNAPLKRPKAF